MRRLEKDLLEFDLTHLMTNEPHPSSGTTLSSEFPGGRMLRPTVSLNAELGSILNSTISIRSGSFLWDVPPPERRVRQG